MSDALIRRTIRRCTAALSIVLGAIAVELASIEYPDGGNLVGGTAMAVGVLYLAASAIAAMSEGDASHGGTPETGDDGSDGDSLGADDSSNDETGSGASPRASMPPFGD